MYSVSISMSLPFMFAESTFALYGLRCTEICAVFFKFSIICRSYQRPNYILPEGCSNLNKSGPDKVKIKAIFGNNQNIFFKLGQSWLHIPYTVLCTW